MTAVSKPEPAQVLMKAFINACEYLGIQNKERGQIIGVNQSTLTRNIGKGFAPESKQGELQLNLIRVYRSLFAIAGGDKEFMRHWFNTEITRLGGKPSELCHKIDGLVRTNLYLDAMRGKC